jgi:hypothetical protein
MTPSLSKRIGALLVGLVLVSVGCGGGSSSGGGNVPGTIKGTVTDTSPSPLAGVTVTAQGAGVPAAVTGPEGTYSMLVPPGSYTLAFSGDSLEPATASASVGAGATVTVDQTMQPSTLVVKVNLPAALQNGGPAGVNTSVSGITASVTLGGSAASADSITWEVLADDGVSPPPSPATFDTTTGGFAIPDFETVRQGANLWLNTRYGTAGTEDAFDYITAPERDQLLSFGPQQVGAMSYMVKATAKVGSRTSSGSAVVAPVTISNGGNELSTGMMVVANAPSAASYSWTVQFLPMSASSLTWQASPDALQGTGTKNPTLIPSTPGVYMLQNGSDAPLYFRAATYHGAGKADTDKGSDGVACADCHAGQFSLAGKFADWNASAHGNKNWQDPFAKPMGLVQFGLDGGNGQDYFQFCMSCHTVGYTTVPSAAGNKGFYDLIASSGWSFPTTLQPGNFDALPPELKHRAGIQCEACHGPLEPTDHSQAEGLPALFGLPLSPVASMNAGVCLNCHDEFPFHDKGPLWSASPHAQVDLVQEAMVENRGTTAAHCGRCHAGEGFLVYVAQEQAGGAGAWNNIARPASLPPISATTCTPNPALVVDPACICAQAGDVAAQGLPAATSPACYPDPDYYNYLNGLGLNEATAHSQTCQTCHDPHKTTLRADGDSHITAAAFQLQNAGAGALCIVCHNTRNGAKFNDTAMTSWSAPHTPSQSDVFVGRNAFFFGKVQPAGWPTNPAAAGYTAALNAAIMANATDLPNKAAHAFMADTCVDCHVKWVPPDIQAQFKPAGTNHTFKTTRQVCANCHGPEIGDLVASQVDEKMGELSTELGVLFRNKINLGVDDMAGLALNPDGTISDTKLPGNHNPTDSKFTIGTTADNSVTNVVISTLHGSPALIVTLGDGTVLGAAISSTSATSFLKGGAVIFGGTKATAFTPAQLTAAKATYNYLFVQGGGAHGFHNPAYVNGVLDATLALVAPIPAL